MPFMLGIALLSGLLTGILPSLAITSVKVLQIMKQGNNWSMKRSVGKINAKRVIITVQFCATIILISSAMVAHRQFNFINDKNLGLKPDQILSITDVPDMVTKQYIVFKNLLKEVPGVLEVSACMQVPSSEIRDLGSVLVRGLNEDVNKAPMIDIQIIDPDFIEMMGLEFLAGEDFSSKVTLHQVPEFSEDFKLNDYLARSSKEYLINETAMKQLGWEDPSEAIGQEITWSNGSFDLAYGPIVGVINDYHQESLRNKIDPMLLIVEPIWLKNVLIKTETKNLEKTIAEIENTWNDLFPYALEYEFLDELFNKLYDQDRIQLELLSTLAIIAILISFMGLVSMVAFALKRRSKELAIRRVFGANLGSLTRLIGKEYFWVLAVAAFAGIPMSYLWVTEWLQSFAYRINVLPFVYLLSVIILYAILLIIIHLQTFKATTDNPADALREE
jgi:putative ABC transport system permease protein